VYAKVYDIPDVYFNYVAYMDPGATTPAYLIVTLQPLKGAASDAELAAYRGLVSSIGLFMDSPKPD
jgi:hypothetical protein